MCAKRKLADKKRILFSDDFYSDLSGPDMLYAVLIQSPFSCGVISSISFSRNTKLPEGYYLFTASDFGNKSLNILGMDIPLLCKSRIAYKGQGIALLIGSDKEKLEELKDEINIELEGGCIKKLEEDFERSYKRPSISFNSTQLNDSPVSHSNFLFADKSSYRENVAIRKIRAGNVNEVFSNPEKSAFVIEGKWNNHIRYDSNKETEGAMCYMKGGGLHVFTPCQWLSQLETSLCQITRLPKEKIFITRTRITHKTTSALWQNCIMTCLTGLAAIKTGKTVKFSLSRSAQRLLLESPSEISITHKTALDKNGIITAMRINIVFDAGFYNPFAQDILDRLAIASTGIYNCKNVSVNARAVKSCRAPSSLQLSMIDSQAFYAMENQIQKIAGITGFSPVDLRQMNKAGGLQKVTSPFLYSFGRSSDAINAVAIRSDFKRKYAVARLSQNNRYDSKNAFSYSPQMRGMGLACSFDGSGYLGTYFEKSNITMQVSVTEDKKIVVHAYPPSAAIREIWLRLITDSIDIDRRSIQFTNEKNEETGKKTSGSVIIPEGLIGTVSIRTTLLQKCIDSVKRKKIDGTPFSVKKSIPLARKKLWNQTAFSGSPYYNTAFGCCTVELEIDSITFRANLRKICVIIDGGKILNPKSAENAVYCSIQRALSMLVEGECLSCPHISVQFMQSEEEAKQIGHLVYSMLPAAFTSALSQALGVTVKELPLKTDSIFKICEVLSQK